MTITLYRLGGFAARRPFCVIGAWLVLAVLTVGASGAFGRKLEDRFDAPGLDSTAALTLLTSAQSESAGLTAQVVATPRDGSTFVASSPARAALVDLQKRLRALPNVIAINDPAGELNAEPQAAALGGSVSPDGRVALLRVQYPVLGELSVEDLNRLKDAVAEAGVQSPLRIETNGDLFFAFAEAEGNASELIGLGTAVLILLLAFGSLVAMGLPIGVAIFGLALGTSAMPLFTYVIELPSWAPQIASMVGLGVGIDYALFVVTRHREFLARGMTVSESAGRAIATAGQAVIFAGGTVVIAILGLAVSGVPFVTAAGVAISLVVLLMVIASVTLLPAFLGLAGHRINGLRMSRRRVAEARQLHQMAPGPTVSVRWERWGRHVSSHPWVYAIGTTMLLLAVAAPVLALRLGFPDDGSQPTNVTQRRAYDLVAQGFGPGVNGPLVIAVDISGDATVVEPLRQAISADAGIAGVAPPQVNTGAGVATIVAFPKSAPQDRATFATVDRLRTSVFPEVLAGHSARAHIGGQTATFGDVGGRVSDRLPLFVTAVVLLSLMLLTFVFRSIVVAAKAAIMNLLSIGAAYGVLVMVFQWGWGKSLIGLETTVPIVAFVPMFMFAVLFGLSMDYEVFLLSRVREEYLLTGDNETSVIHGIALTARVITSAALIMISVFLAFVLGDDPTTKMFGVGLATAIFVDATVVRMVLVPATMKLMGNANWWLPGWLDRLIPTIDIDGETGLPEPHMDTAAPAVPATRRTRVVVPE